MISHRVLMHTNPQFGKCPQCKSIGTLHRSRSRNMFEQILKKVTFYKTYRCKECGWRGFRSSLTITRKSMRQLLIYLIIIFITALIARYLIVNYALN